MARPLVNMRAETRDDDSRMRALMTRIDEDVDHVDIGIHGDIDGKDLVLIASANEFGTADGHIPPRPFIRSTVDEQERRIDRLAEHLWGQVLDGTITKRFALERMGIFIEGEIKRKIIELDSPPNAPATIRKKKSSNPLVDTGRLGDSVRYIVG